jgi:hypothetical protein
MFLIHPIRPLALLAVCNHGHMLDVLAVAAVPECWQRSGRPLPRQHKNFSPMLSSMGSTQVGSPPRQAQKTPGLSIHETPHHQTALSFAHPGRLALPTLPWSVMPCPCHPLSEKQMRFDTWSSTANSTHIRTPNCHRGDAVSVTIAPGATAPRIQWHETACCPR